MESKTSTSISLGLRELTNEEQLNIFGGDAEAVGEAVGYVVGFAVGFTVFGAAVAGILVFKKILT